MMVSKQTSYIKDKSLRPDGMAEVTVNEALFFGLLAVNLSMLLYRPAYNLFYEYFNRMAFVVIPMLLISMFYLEFNLLKATAFFIFLGLAYAVICINHSAIGVLVQFIWPLSIFFIVKYSKLSRYFIARVTAFMLAAWLISLYNARLSQEFFANAKILTRSIGINPNTVATVVVSSCLYLDMYIESAGRSKGLKLVLYAISLGAVLMTESRTSTIALVMMLMLELVFRGAIQHSKTLAVLLMVGVIVLGMVVPFLYTNMSRSDMVSYDTQFMGKTIYTGRQLIWANFFTSVAEHPETLIWGIGYTSELYYGGTFNLHNAYFQLIAQFGAPLFIMYMGYLMKIVYDMYGHRGQLSNIQFKCYQVVLMTMCIGWTEGVFSFEPTMIFFALALGIGSRRKDKGVMT